MKKQDYSFNRFNHILLVIAWVITTLCLSILFINVQAANNECMINLDNNTHTCENISAITFVSQPNNHQTVAKISLEPALGYTKVIFDVTYGSEPTDWTINIGDSASNNGWAGDGADQSNDAEIQIKGKTLAVYGNDYIPSYETTDGTRHILSVPEFIQSGEVVRLEVRDSHLSWLSSTTDDELTSPYLYALNGQTDDEGSSNYDIYAAFNRVISSSYRSGSGVSSVCIKLTYDTDSTGCSNTSISTAPVLNPIGDQAITQGETLSFTATASDADGDILGFSLANNAPIDAYIDYYTGEFSWTPTEAGYVDLTVTVTEAYGTPSTSLSDEETITITVNEPEESFTETDDNSQWTNEWQDSTDNEWSDDTSQWIDDDLWQNDDENIDDDSWQNDDDNTSSWTDDDSYEWQDSTNNEWSENNEGSYSPSLDSEVSDNNETVEMVEETTSDDELNISANLGNETLEVNVDNTVSQDEFGCTQSETSNTNSEALNKGNCQNPNNNEPVFNNIGNPAINITINLPEAYNQPTVPNNENLPTANMAQSDVNLLNIVEEEATSLNDTLTVGLLGNGRVIGNNIDCGMDCTETYLKDSIVTLIAVPEIESRFIAWMGDCSGNEQSTTVTMNAAMNCVAVFEQEQTFEQAQAESAKLPSSDALLKLIKVGAGNGHVSTTLSGIDCGVDCDENYPNGSVVTLTATPEIDSRFIGWGGDCRGTSNPITVTIREAVICATLFDTIPQQTLTINQAGSGMGTVTASVGLENGINCGTDCIENYYEGDTITLTAIPKPDALFVGWAEPNCADSLIITANINCTAIFEQLPHYTVTLNTIGKGSIINTAGLACGSHCVSYLSGTPVTLTAIPDSEAHFTGWEGDCVGADSLLSLTLTTDMACTATFTGEMKDAEKNAEIRNSQTTLFQLPALLDVFAINAQGEIVNTDAQFAGGISSNSSDFQLQVTQTLSDLVDIRGRILIDSLHVGQPIDICVVVGVQSPFNGMGNVPIYFMLDDTGNVLPWDGDIANLVTFKTVKSATQRVEVPIYNGQFVAPGILNIYFGYRSAEGLVIYSPENMEVIISE